MTDIPSSNTLDPELLSILRCPLTRSVLRQEGDFLIAEIGGLAYPVRDGIPVMLIEEARLPQGVASLDEFKQRFGDQIPR
ncbi:MAG: Trm112 family protein [Tepidisphaeraceae bacterium]